MVGLVLGIAAPVRKMRRLGDALRWSQAGSATEYRRLVRAGSAVLLPSAKEWRDLLNDPALADVFEPHVPFYYQLGHQSVRETMGYAVVSESKRREKAARIRIARETW
jgi:hypothetical protein